MNRREMVAALGAVLLQRIPAPPGPPLIVDGPTGPTVASVRVTGLGPRVGGVRQLKAVAVMADQSELDVTMLAIWRSRNTAIVTVDARGLARGIAQGTAVVEASYP